jgi:hypothetical protein
MKFKLAALAGIAAVAAAGVALASVTFDPVTGVGFVGKGDVQLVYGQNNSQIQNALIANPQAYTFSFVQVTSYDVVCEWDTVTGGKNSKTIHHATTNTTSTAVNAAINGSPRQVKGQTQFTGFNLTGLGAVTVTGDPIPQVGDSCHGDPADAAPNGIADLTSVQLSFDNLPGSLFVTYLGNTQPLPITPVVII